MLNPRLQFAAAGTASARRWYALASDGLRDDRCSTMQWIEKDCWEWAHEHLREYLCGVELDDAGVARTTDMPRCEGECLMLESRGTARARAVYDIAATLRWEAGSKGGGQKAVGVLEIEEINADSVREGLVVKVKVTDLIVADESVRAQMQDLVQKCAARTIAAKVELFVSALHKHLGTVRDPAEIVKAAAARIAADNEADDEEFTDEMMEGMLSGMNLQWNSDDDDETESIPLFMDDDQFLGSEGNEAADALKAIMDEQDTPELRAEELKDEGNAELKKGLSHRPVALNRYSQALELKCKDQKLNSVIYSNRAHVHMLNRNWGRALADCKAAIDADGSNVKAYFRATKCCNTLHKTQYAMLFAEKGLRRDKGNTALKAELKKAKAAYRKENEKKKEKKATQIVAKQEEKSVQETTLRQGVSMGKAVLECQNGEYAGAEPCLVDGVLCWPVLFVYEEHRQRDFVQMCPSDACLADQLQQMFPPAVPPPPWDPAASYAMGRLAVYFVEEWAGSVNREGEWQRGWHDGATSLGRKYVEVDITQSLEKVLLHPKLTVPQWPIFHVFVRGAPFTEQFLKGRT